MRRKRAAACLAVAVVLGGAIAVGASTRTPAARASGPSVSAEQLLAANLQWTDVKRVLPKAKRSYWWPLPPEFETGVDPTAQHALLEVAQQFEFVSPDFRKVESGDNLTGTMMMFASPAAAATQFAKDKALDGPKTISGPTVRADRVRYSQRGKSLDVTDTLRWQVGRFVGRIAWRLAGPTDPKTLAALFAPVGSRLARLEAGRLGAPPLGAAARLLPAAAAAPGPVRGTAAMPAESWAVVDTSGNPFAARAKLEAGGVGALLLRRYAPTGLKGNVLETVLFPFTSAASAQSWVTGFKDAVGNAAITPGSTGDTSVFTANGGKFYELQFARGRLVGDVSCWSPFGKTSQGCETVVRGLAEKWYASLAGAR